MQNSAYNSLPIYRKSLALRDLSSAVATYFSNDTTFFKLQRTASLREDIAISLYTDSSLISQQIKQAETSNSYEIRMKSATFINVITRNILCYCNGLEHDGVKEKEYVNLLRRELKSFRKSFKQWRKSLQ
ncbi:hypothetical protein [uncultured Croceitalea sp.]|uniref:hypothetical protein n=1 Tax=uncultured Croceitalea sp. TaxID=1798908 RepID=UPI0033066E56